MDAPLYEELYRVEQEHWWFRARREIVWSLVERYVEGARSRRLRVCELGCGTGGNLAAIADRHDVVGVECSPHALEFARKRLGDRVVEGSLPHQVNLPASAYDVVLLTDVLEHVEDDSAAALTAMRLLRPGGIVVATVPAYQWLYSPRDAAHHHFRRYGKNQFRRLWPECEGTIEVLSHYNSLLFPAAAVERLASKAFNIKKATGDLVVPPWPLNGLLKLLLRNERYAIGRVPLLFGLSLIAVVRKQALGNSVKFAA